MHVINIKWAGMSLYRLSRPKGSQSKGFVPGRGHTGRDTSDVLATARNLVVDTFVYNQKGRAI